MCRDWLLDNSHVRSADFMNVLLCFTLEERDAVRRQLTELEQWFKL